MKIIKSWLKEYVDVEISDEELSDKLTFSGSLVEEVSGGLDEKIIVAKIKEVSKHPNADKLQIALVDTGEDELKIVCGAPNIEAGQKVPLAKIGTKIDDFEIKEAEIRGEKSFGMLCSKHELGLGEDHSGIFILPEDYEIGQSLNKYIKSDSIFELEITPNRGDCLSHLGIAREVSAVLSEKLNFQPIDKYKALSDFEVEIENHDSCFQYLGAKIKNVKIGPSPEWLQDRLKKVDVNPINNLVDITNYIMMDLGQPMHAFDSSKVKGKIIVRNAREDEVLYCLDEVTRDLSENMLVIADEKNPIAIAGVIGGMDSSVTINTTEIILESAQFERRSVRKTSKDLSVMTDASYRFERGIDSEATEFALQKAIKMIEEICDGEFEGKFSLKPYERKYEFVKIEYKKIDELIGLQLSQTEINAELEKVGFQINNDMAKVPSWRNDVSIWQDLAEEVVRIYGMGKVENEPVKMTQKPRKSDYYFKEYLKDYLVDFDFVEVSNYPFISQKDVETLNLPDNDLLEVANPIQTENKFMRNSLKVGLMKNIAKNPTFDQILIFEIANVFTKETEESHLGLLIASKNSRKIIDDLTEKIKEDFGINIDIFEPTEDEKAKYKVKRPNVFGFEMKTAEFINKLKEKGINPELKVEPSKAKYRKVSKLPPVVIDLAFVVERDIPSKEILNHIYTISENILMAEIFDEFESPKLGEGKKSVAFKIYLQDLKKTLSADESQKIMNDIILKTEEKFQAKLRS